MKRDPEIILAILKDVIESDLNCFENKLAIAKGPLMKGIETDRGRQNQIRAEHVRWMMDEGLITMLGGSWFRVTSAGCEFYENATTSGVWEKTQAVVAQEGGTLAFELVREVAKGFARAQLKKYTGLDL